MLRQASQRLRLPRCFLVSSATILVSASYSSSRSITFLERQTDKSKDSSPPASKSDNDEDSSTSFFSSLWQDAATAAKHDWGQKLKNMDEQSQKAKEFWNKTVNDSAIDDEKQAQGSHRDDTATTKTSQGDFSALASNMMKLFAGSSESQEQAISDIVAKARETASKSDVSDERSFVDLLEALNSYKEMIRNVANKYIASIDLSKVDPTALFYYLEYEDERKNPSWKRRKHRFYDGIDFNKVEQLNAYLDLARISYANSVKEIKQALENNATPCELLYAEVVSEPGKPANYVAIPRNQPKYSNHLEVIIGVRGTNSLADVITDLICEDAAYRGGKAHSFIVNSGKFIAEQHVPMLEELLENSGKARLKLTLVGHSLGAGAASIAGMELQDHDRFDVQVFGFGCPALLSEDLAATSDFITTVVNDSDVVPRMSGISVANLLLDVLQFDWFAYAERDAEEMIDSLHERHPVIFNKDFMLKAKEVLAPHIREYAESKIVRKAAERGNVELFPPGKCIHIYRDGVGYSGSFVPNTFFAEVDVSRRMLDDHMFFSGYQQTFLELMRQHKGDHHFRFDQDANIDSK